MLLFARVSLIFLIIQSPFRVSLVLCVYFCQMHKVVVEIKIPEDIVETFAIGPHLKGVANYLLKSCNGRYDQYVVGKRLLVYTEVAAPDMSDNRFPMEDRLEAVAKFARLLERSDEDAMDAISRILVILKDSENSITGL